MRAEVKGGDRWRTTHGLFGDVSVISSCMARLNPRKIKQKISIFNVPWLSTFRQTRHSHHTVISHLTSYCLESPQNQHNYNLPLRLTPPLSQRGVLFLSVCLCMCVFMPCIRDALHTGALARWRLRAGGLWERRRRRGWRVSVGQRTCCGYKHSGTANVLRADRNPLHPRLHPLRRPTLLPLSRSVDRLPL